MIEIVVKYSDDAEDTLRFDDPVGIEKISLSLYKCFNRKGVDVISATSSVVSGKALVFTANDDGDVLLNGKEPDDEMVLTAGDDPLHLVVTMVEGGVQNQQKRKIADPGQKVSMGKLLIQVLKYFNKRNVQVQEARVVITEKQEISFDLSEDGEILVNGQIPEEGLQLTASYEPPPPPAPTPTPAKIIQAPVLQAAPVSAQPQVLTPQLQSSQELAEMQRQMEVMKARMLELQQQGGAPASGIVMPSADELQEFGGIAAQGAGQSGASGASATGAPGGGRRPKQVPPGSPIASYAAEYELFDPNPEESSKGITTIGYPRQPKVMEYRPPGADGEVKQVVPRGTRLQALHFAAHRGGGLVWMLRDPRTRREYAIPEICLTSPMDQGANLRGDFEHAPLEYLDYMPEKQEGTVTGTVLTSDGAQPVYDKITLENLDDQVAAVASMPGGGKRSLEDIAIAQVERFAGPSIGGGQDLQAGKRPGIKMMDKLAPSVVERLGNR